MLVCERPAKRRGPPRYDGPFKVYRPGEHSKTGLSAKVPIGAKFGRLTVEGLPFVAGASGKNNARLFHVHVVCLCECGTFIAIPANHLTNGRQTSCGCNRGKHLVGFATKHGGRGTKLFNVWSGMRQRCLNKDHKHYHLYGGRGVTICQEWSTFQGFRDWALSSGYQEGLALDRKKPPPLGYSPDNCQWLTRVENGKKVWTDMAAASAQKDAMIDALIAALAGLA